LKAGLARVFLLTLLIGLLPGWSRATDFAFRPPATVADPTTPAVMRDLAVRVIPVYQDPDSDRYLANLSALQMAAGDYVAADRSRRLLRDRRRRADFGLPINRSVIYDMYAHARAAEADGRTTFAEAFAGVFRDTIHRLADKDAYVVTRWLGAAPGDYRDSLQSAFDQLRSRDSLDQTDAIDLVWKYVASEAFRTFGPLVILLNAEDDTRRYIVDNDLVIPAGDGTDLFATVIRPRNAGSKLPTLLEFTIYDAQLYAKESAARGYAAVVAYTRGTRPDAKVSAPYEHDGEDARAVINWIAMQPWSDGRVGMYGEEYSGFSPWAAATQMPPALKAIATSAATAPGINFPMQGNIFHNAAFQWSLRVADTEAFGENSDNDPERWRQLNQKWYRSGRRFRDIGRLFGTPSPIFNRWLNHPSYDRFWQKLIPYRQQFAHIDIPVLAMSGYFAANQPGDLYYFLQHHRYNPHAEHTLIIGPYDDKLMQRGLSANLNGLQVDSAARIDFRELRFQWFDHIFKGGAKPPLLQDNVNYQVMGSNEWRHAPSLDAMGGKSLKFFLEASTAAAGHRLVLHRKKTSSYFKQTMGFVDRSDAAWTPSTDLVNRSLAPRHGMMFVSEPLSQPTEFSGLFSGRLDFTVNKMDVDLNISLFELLANGDYVRLFSPIYEFRASYARDRTRRHLLGEGERRQLTFRSERLTSRLLQKGSRLVMILGVNKRPDRQINYGTGNDVSEESIADGKIPLKIRWYSDSYIEIPVSR
jgi:putative CocE/NonD family hydrolase